jgi:rhodanese-related sulfurtransferase
MKHFVRDLAGGIAIIAAAVVIGVLHNAVRGQSIPLIQKVEVVKTANHGNGGEGATPGGSNESPAELPEGAVTVDQIKALFDGGDVYIIDARGPEGFAEGHIPGAINVPYDRLAEYYQDLTGSVPTDAKVICYCWSPTCDFSDQLATELKIMGYTDVAVFTGGWEHWQDAGHPVEGGATGD